MESVDYTSTFITVAPDCPTTTAVEPSLRGGRPTVASAAFEMIHDHPYELRAPDVLFTVWADRRDIADADRDAARAEFYAKPQACMRASDLGKRYGWGVHSDADGRIALYGVGSAEYEALVEGRDPLSGSPVTVKAAMRSKR